MKKIYLDYAATTPVDPAVEKTMRPYLSRLFGNPGSLHSFGQEAMAAVDEAREKIAKAIAADFREIIFTSGATEANNLVIRGVMQNAKRPSGERSSKNQNDNSKFKIIVSSVEHESIIETAKDLEKEGVEVVYLPVSKEGIVDLKKMETSMDENTVLVSIMSANNEIGALQSIEAVSKLIADFKKNNHYLLFHTDHSQGFQYLDIKPREFGIDLMTLSSHKIYGPKGAGALFVNHEAWNMKHKTENSKMLQASGFMLHPVTTGGGQEFGMRSGTENVPAIVGFGKAVEIAGKLRNKEIKRIVSLRNYFWKKIKEIYPRAELNGPGIKEKFDRNLPLGRNSVGINRLPNNLNIYFPGESAQDLLMKLDLAGVAVSAGSACSARSAKLSHVLEACGFGKERIKSSLRITLGRPTTKEEIDEAVRRLSRILRN